MARYEHLPICKAAQDMTVHFEPLVAGFSRCHEYTPGTELRDGSRAVLMQVVRANNAPDAAARATRTGPAARTPRGIAACPARGQGGEGIEELRRPARAASPDSSSCVHPAGAFAPA